MKHVRVRFSAGGREADIHPMYDLLTNAPFVERATAIQWNFTGSEFGIMHFVEGDVDAFATAVDDIPVVVAYEVEPTGEHSFYAYIRDETTDATRAIFGAFARKPMVVVPPIVYTADWAELSVFGPAGEIQAMLDRVPDPMSVEVVEVTGLASLPDIGGPTLSDRQRDAIDAALDLGYYDIPRTASHEDVADAIDCAPSTAAEHIRKGEAKLIRNAVQR